MDAAARGGKREFNAKPGYHHSPAGRRRRCRCAHRTDGRDAAALGSFKEYSESPAIITALLDAGANVNARDYIWNGRRCTGQRGLMQSLAIITALLDAGADINARDTNGETPLHSGSC